jgi:hypothetical protein
LRSRTRTSDDNGWYVWSTVAYPQAPIGRTAGAVRRRIVAVDDARPVETAQREHQGDGLHALVFTRVLAAHVVARAGERGDVTVVGGVDHVLGRDVEGRAVALEGDARDVVHSVHVVRTDAGRTRVRDEMDARLAQHQVRENGGSLGRRERIAEVGMDLAEQPALDRAAAGRKVEIPLVHHPVGQDAAQLRPRGNERDVGALPRGGNRGRDAGRRPADDEHRRRRCLGRRGTNDRGEEQGGHDGSSGDSAEHGLYSVNARRRAHRSRAPSPNADSHRFRRIASRDDDCVGSTIGVSERGRFELPIRFTVCSLSKRVHSTALPPLQDVPSRRQRIHAQRLERLAAPPLRSGRGARSS